MYKFLCFIRRYYWRLALFSATMMSTQASRQLRQADGPWRVLFWILTYAVCYFTLFFASRLWNWLRHEYVIQQILKCPQVPHQQLMLPGLYYQVDSLRYVLLNGIIAMVAGVIMGLIDFGQYITLAVFALLVVSDAILIGLCLFWRFERYRLREVLIIDVATAIRVALGRPAPDVVTLYSPNSFKVEIYPSEPI